MISKYNGGVEKDENSIQSQTSGKILTDFDPLMYTVQVEVEADMGVEAVYKEYGKNR